MIDSNNPKSEQIDFADSDTAPYPGQGFCLSRFLLVGQIAKQARHDWWLGKETLSGKLFAIRLGLPGDEPTEDGPTLRETLIRSPPGSEYGQIRRRYFLALALPAEGFDVPPLAPHLLARGSTVVPTPNHIESARKWARVPGSVHNSVAKQSQGAAQGATTRTSATPSLPYWICHLWEIGVLGGTGLIMLSALVLGPIALGFWLGSLISRNVALVGAGIGVAAGGGMAIKLVRGMMLGAA
jgi:hypothetical protein